MAEPIDMATDGTSIGEVNAAPVGDAEVECKPAVFDEDTGLVSRLELAMSPDAVLAGDGAVPAEVVEAILPKYGDKRLRLEAAKLYVTGDYSMRAIAEAIDAPERTVARWAEEGNWIEFSERTVETLKRHEKARLAAKRIREREKAIDEQIELGHKIAEAGREFIENAETAGQFKAAAEGVKLGSDMVGRALAINESGKVDADSSKEEGEGGRQPLVAIIAGGDLPAVQRGGEVIDVKQL